MIQPVARAVARLGCWLCAYRGRRFADTIEQLVQLLHKRLNNSNFDSRTNGEERVLRIVSEAEPRCIFDVGAHQGEWSLEAAAANPACTIHAFEVVPEIHRQLVRRTRGLSSIQAHGFGLAKVDGDVSISMTQQDASVSTACKIDGMPFHDATYDRQVSCPVRRAATFIEQHLDPGQPIDFVKIDVEGMDLQVIQGFADQLSRVRALQFEYGVFNISSHDLLADFWRHLESHDFLVGKIFPRCVVFQRYHFTLETLHGSNFLAVRRHEIELIERLQCFGE